jgi:uncharacterized protein YqgV (UPF0045/DUF77 family)
MLVAAALAQTLVTFHPLGGYSVSHFIHVEGPWAKVSQAIYECHAAVHEMGAPRIVTELRIATRTDREAIGHGHGNMNQEIVRRVEILAQSGS